MMATSASSKQVQYHEVEPIFLDVSARALSYRGRMTMLSKRQWEIVHALLRVPGATVSSASLRALLDERSPDALSEGALTVHIHHLRQKLGALPVQLLRNRGAAGYFLNFEVPLEVLKRQPLASLPALSAMPEPKAKPRGFIRRRAWPMTGTAERAPVRCLSAHAARRGEAGRPKRC
jgi:DNA-binding winged helix-turn-helix (wHTH) protein